MTDESGTYTSGTEHQMAGVGVPAARGETRIGRRTLLGGKNVSRNGIEWGSQSIPPLFPLMISGGISDKAEDCGCSDGN